MSFKSGRDFAKRLPPTNYFSDFLEKLRDRFWFRVLVVEDSPESRNLLRLAMDTLPCMVDYASNGASAEDYLLSKEYDLLIVDQDLPDTNGISMLNLVSSKAEEEPLDKRGVRIPFIVYSGLDLKPPLKMEKFFFADFIRKPTNIVAIHDRISTILRNYEYYRGVGQNL